MILHKIKCHWESCWCYCYGIVTTTSTQGVMCCCSTMVYLTLEKDSTGFGKRMYNLVYLLNPFRTSHVCSHMSSPMNCHIYELSCKIYCCEQIFGCSWRCNFCSDGGCKYKKCLIVKCSSSALCHFIICVYSTFCADSTFCRDSTFCAGSASCADSASCANSAFHH